MLSNDILNWYEASLPVQERKMRGHFSTPPQLVEQILDACGYTSDQKLSHLRVLDPACGSGNFLVGVTQRLLAAGRHRGLSSQSQIAVVQRNVWGFDPDPVSCFLAEMRLRTLCEQHTPASLHVHQADGLAFPWQHSESVDLFLANPPYLAAKNNDLSGYQVAHQRGQTDSYLLFLSLALQIVRPGGWIGLVIPDPVLARANAILERRRLLAETTVHHLWHLAGVFSAYVGAVVIIAQKRPPTRVHQVAWVRETWPQLNGKAPIQRRGSARLIHERSPHLLPAKNVVSQKLLHNQPGAELRYLLGSSQENLVERLHAYLCMPHAGGELVSLSELVMIRRGEELGKQHAFLQETRPDDGQEWYPVLRGGSDVRSYCTRTSNCWIAREKITKSLERYLAPKLLVVKSTGRLQAALDLRKHVVLQTLYLLCLRSDVRPELRALGRSQDASCVTGIGAPSQNCEDTSQNDLLYFLLALLNSRLLQQYVYVLCTAYKWVQPQIEQYVLAHLPIPTIESALVAQISQRARALMSACSQMTSVVELNERYKQMYEEQEHAICLLYEKVLDNR